MLGVLKFSVLQGAIFSFFLLLDRVLELQNCKVQLNGCLCIARLQVVIKDSGDQFAASLHEGLLIRFIFNNR